MRTKRHLGAAVAFVFGPCGSVALASDVRPSFQERTETAVLITASTAMGWLRSVCLGYLEDEARRRSVALQAGEPRPPSPAATHCERVLKGDQPELPAPPG
jgi:hypothetical protein